MSIRLPRPENRVYLRLEFPKDKQAALDDLANEVGNLSSAALGRVVMELLAAGKGGAFMDTVREEVRRRRAEMATQQPKPEPKKRGRPSGNGQAAKPEPKKKGRPKKAG
jgi:hypothetical protein